MSALDPSALVVSHLTVHHKQTPVLSDLFLEIHSGLVAIVGPNGAGKSTLIRAILGLVRPVTGRVLLLGEPLHKIRKRVAYIPQKESVDWDFPIRVDELVLMGRYGHVGLFQRPSRADRKKAHETLERVGLLEYADRQINQLSGGQQQRAFLARGLAQEADLYFLDEPFSGIDMASSKVLFEILQELKRKGKTVFVVHHDLREVQEAFDTAILLNVRLIAAGPVSSVLTEANLERAYGKDQALWGQVAALNVRRQAGYAS